MNSSSDVEVNVHGVIATGMVGKLVASTLERRVGYVALLDVLGFRDIVSRDGHRNYMTTVADLIADPRQGHKLEYVLFSDTVVVSTLDDAEDTLFALLKACSSLFDALLKQDVPMRGAIALGTFDRSSTVQGVVVAGAPIVEAYQYELRQNWIGVMLCPSVLRKYPGLPAQCSFPDTTGRDQLTYVAELTWPRVLKGYQIPFHDDRASERFYQGVALVPMSKDITTLGDAKKSLTSAHAALERMKIAAPDPAAQRKYDHAISFVDVALGAWPKIR